ncbi:hypothetical protein COEREDRAFT_43163 [Coemansia reversa NRRL 1564]|uniref:Mannosyltransferase n=1 Tax=Coemansia reversa (strain ATCC 12441 / NRRL 1564) TaxID=763665 RepID=A0A2G5BB31_COERN|nr:hypothetical protein COEREDRAFT_43163 [Coemansia reversa NRRL 1564]|eukprot:PIA16224.1 hypothetical protein COEREDRAFT_43163 [Coemansia reversa NRRL 1564]
MSGARDHCSVKQQLIQRVSVQFRSPSFILLLILRLFNAAAVQTYIHPDETWQSLEIAHRIAFGYGFTTWEWRHALRGFAHPMVFAAVYRILNIFSLDDTFLILFAPYALVAAIAAAVDYATFYFARRIAGDRVASWALLCSLVSWSMSTGVMRPLVNSAETALTAAAFAYWPWNSYTKSLTEPGVSSTTGASLPIALIFAALACVIRPTSGVLWLCAGIVLLVKQPRVRWISRTVRIITMASVIGAVAIAIMLVIDYIGYERWVFPPYQFYLFNVSEDLATWFGETPALYHLYTSMPILFTSMLPFVLHGVYLSYRDGVISCEPAVVAFSASVLFSLVGHMEYRFLYPLLPIGFVYAAVNIFKKNRLWTAANMVIYLLLTNVIPALYLDLVHQRGVVDVMDYLRRGVKSGNVTDIGFLMPCHSTPYYSHLHANVPMWFLGCEPPLTKAELAEHYWEADDFEQNPVEFLHSIFPSHLILYDGTVRRIQNELEQYGYKEKARFFNTHFSGDTRRHGDVVVYQHIHTVPQN